MISSGSLAGGKMKGRTLRFLVLVGTLVILSACEGQRASVIPGVEAGDKAYSEGDYLEALKVQE